MTQRRKAPTPTQRPTTVQRSTRRKQSKISLKLAKRLFFCSLAFLLIVLAMPSDKKDPVSNVSSPTSVETTAPEITAEVRSIPVDTLESAETASPEPTSEPWSLRRGDSNDAVKSLQKRLIALGFLSGSADGIFGEGTENAVKAFQRAAGLSQTGVCDVETATRMKANDAPSIPKPTKASEQTVYITPTGSKYHRKGCQHVNGKTATTITISEAKRRGLTACKDCNP